MSEERVKGYSFCRIGFKYLRLRRLVHLQSHNQEQSRFYGLLYLHLKAAFAELQIIGSTCPLMVVRGARYFLKVLIAKKRLNPKWMTINLAAERLVSMSVKFPWPVGL